MVDHKLQNYKQLWTRFSSRGAIKPALTILHSVRRGDTKIDLKRLLRHHDDDEVIKQKEIDARDSFDRLLEFISCLEVAAIVDLIPAPLPASILTDAELALTNPDVRRYYREHYPLLLPDMLLVRIAGEEPAGPSDPTGTPLFMEFLHVSDLLNRDDDVQTLLWFLEDGSYGRQSWKNVIRTLSNPKKFLEALQTPARDRDAVESGVAGLRKFLVFCVELDELLKQASEHAYLQSSFWHYHAYWFRMIKDEEVSSRLIDAIESFRRWLECEKPIGLSAANLKRMEEEAEASLQQLRHVVGRLTGRTYGKLLSTDERAIRRKSNEAARMINDRKDIWSRA